MTIEQSGQGPDPRSPDVAAASGSADQQAQFQAADWVLFLAISLIWGSSFLLIAEGLEGLTPGLVTLGRVGSGALTLVLLRSLPNASNHPIDRADRVRVVWVAIIWVVIPFTLFPLAQEYINSALTGLLNGGTPVFVAVIALVITGTRPHGGLLAGLVLGFAGVVTLSLPSIGQGNTEVRGIVMVVAATVCYGVALNLAAPLQRRYGAVTLMTPILVIASVLLIPGGLRDWGDNSWRIGPVVAVIALGVIGTGLAYWVMSTLVGNIGAVRASFITYLIPVVSLVLGVAVRNDRVAPLALVGAAMTTVGALLASGRLRLPGPR